MSVEPPVSRLHPHQLMLYAGLCSISVLFLVITLAYALSKPAWNWAQFRFPKVFLLSTLALVASSFTVHAATLAYERDNTLRLRQMLSYTLYLSLMFVVGQFLGWYQLYRAGIYLAGKPDGSYLYLLTGLHVVHVLGGLVALFLLFWHTQKHLGEPVAELLFYTNAQQKIRLGMIATYWHFVDGLWVYLLLFFLFNH